MNIKKIVGSKDEGITTIEIVLLLVVIIAIVIIFKEQVTDLIEAIFEKVTNQAMDV